MKDELMGTAVNAAAIDVENPSSASAVKKAGGRLVKTACQLCGAIDERPVTAQNGWSIVRCARCSFVYVNPRPDNETLARLYLKYLPDKMADPLAWDTYMREVFSKAADVIIRHKPGGRLIDIGCGYGFFLAEMKRRGGWNLDGMDVSTTATDYAASQGFRITQGTLETVGYPDASFDAVTMFYVLEHVTDPAGVLAEVRRILKPGGMLLLRVPHTTPIVQFLKVFGIRNNLYDPPFHLSDFSAATIKRLLEQGGFTNIHTSIGGVTRPPELLKGLTTAAFGIIAEAAYRLSRGRIAMAGVAKNTVAFKP
ncbi:MAG: class I SAM-dependent methyltransferase [Deltaproteobacteria bacterium]|nr:class I SAM-dependent methyltransferase [Deltaproteobacteria bacterium]